MTKLIQCKWADKKRFVVNPDGQVWPCCYFANFTYYAAQFKDNPDKLFTGHKTQMDHEIIQKYYEDPDSKNAFKRPVHEILDDEWFNKTLPESWNSEETLHFQCSKMCRVKDEENLSSSVG